VGGNSGGRLGDGTLTNRKIPTQTSGLTGISLLGAGDDCGIAVTSTGVVYTWGYNGAGQLGDGTVDNRLIPVAISDVNYAWKVATPVFSVASGTYTTERTVIVTNATPGAIIHYTLTGDAPTESDPVIASGASLLIDETRTLKARAWKTGMPASSEASATYTLAVATVVLSPTPTTYTSAQNVSMSTSSPGITIRYTVDGTAPTESSAIYSSPLSIGTTTTVKAIGFRTTWNPSNVTTGTYTMNFGTLATPALDPGTGSYTSQAIVTITAFAGATIRYTTNGSTPTSSSSIYTAPLVFEATTTVKAKAFHPDYATSAEAGSVYTIVVPAPTVSVGSGAYAPGTLVTLTSPDPGATLRITLTGADPIASDPSVPSGTTLAVGGFTLKVRAFKTGCSDSGVVAATYSLTAPLGAGVVAAGGSHSVVATPEGLLYAWGQNTSGQVGIGTTTNRTTPALVPTLTGVTAVAGGQTHTLAATVDGRLFAWGGNSSGQLGDGTTTMRTRPVHIAALSGITAVAAGTSHSLALTAEGEIYAWGLGSNGRLGLGSTTSQQVPTLVPGLSGVVAIAAGSTHSLAVTSAGQVYAWGANSSSQLGDGSTTARPSPTLIAGGTSVIAVAAGASHSLALRGGSEVLAWGAGSSGQLGLGTLTPRTTPASVPDLTAVALSTTGAHGVAVRSDGVLVAWGANASGQIGDTTTTTRTLPTVVIGPASVVALAAGGSHSLAVTPSGDVWTWGAGSAGQLGDGGTAARSTPGAVFTAPGTWGVAAPTLSVPSGTYHVSQIVVVSSSTPDAIVRYTTSGIDPTASDPVIPVTGEILVDASLTLRARAWVPGRAPSAIAAATYTLQPASPTVTPSTGTYSTAQSVSMSTTTGDTTLRCTLDGTDPTETSPLYTGPFTVDTSAVAKARAFRANWTPSAPVSATWTFNYGMLAEPIASPGGGTYPEAQTVALTAVAGATMRYTLDGSDPTDASQLYGAPIAVGPGSTILKARAFKSDWTPSTILTQTYTVDVTPPTITPRVSPTPTATGWNNTDVTVTFVCADNSGVVNCPAPVVINQDGAGQVVTGTASDGAGNQASGSVTVNIDRTPGTVAISGPADGLITSETSIVLSGDVSDGSSEIASATCNGVPATVTDGHVECTVTLQPGLNSVVLFARDAAGNGISAGVRVTRTGPFSAIRLDPSGRTLLVGESQAFTLLDEYGVAVTGSTWASSDTGVVTVDASGDVTAVAAGTATIIATAQGLTAEGT
jgi:alpha-tubulin suppressor-like RCC1 family protein